MEVAAEISILGYKYYQFIKNVKVQGHSSGGDLVYFGACKLREGDPWSTTLDWGYDTAMQASPCFEHACSDVSTSGHWRNNVMSVCHR